MSVGESDVWVSVMLGLCFPICISIQLYSVAFLYGIIRCAVIFKWENSVTDYLLFMTGSLRPSPSMYICMYTLSKWSRYASASRRDPADYSNLRYSYRVSQYREIWLTYENCRRMATHVRTVNPTPTFHRLTRISTYSVLGIMQVHTWKCNKWTCYGKVTIHCEW